MKYKNIESAAHNFADSFASAANHDSGDSILSHLARRVISSGSSELRADLLTGGSGPPELLAEPVAQSLGRRIAEWPSLLARQGVEIGKLRAATFRILFEPTRTSADVGFPDHTEIPFDAWVTVIDDRGKEHVAHFRRWWSFRT